MLLILRLLLLRMMAEFAEMQLPWTGVVAANSLSLRDPLFGRDETRRERERNEPINLSGSNIACTGLFIPRLGHIH